MRLRPLYTLRFFYPKDYAVEVKNPEDKTAPGKEEEMFFFAEGTCEGIISGRFKGSSASPKWSGKHRPSRPEGTTPVPAF